MASTTINHIQNEPALHRSAPETILQLPQQQAEERAKRQKRSPKAGQGLRARTWHLGLTAVRILMREVTVVYRFWKQLGNRKRKQKKQIYLQPLRAKLERKCDTCHRLFCHSTVMPNHYANEKSIICTEIQLCSDVEHQTSKEIFFWKNKHQWAKWT